MSSVTLNVLDAGAGSPVVLLHGLFGCAPNLGVINRPLQKNHRVLAMDLRNHGGSPHMSGMTYAGMAGDIIATLDAKNIQQFAVVGHSMGGKVAMQLALTHPDRVRALGVMDIAPARYRPAFRAYLDNMLSMPLSAPLTRPAADRHLAEVVPEPPIRSFLLQNLRLGDAPQWRIGVQEISDALTDIEDWHTPDDIVPYRGPTLFFAGANSRYIKPDHWPTIQTLFPASRLITIENAGHWLHAENPAPIVAALDEFLGG